MVKDLLGASPPDSFFLFSHGNGPLRFVRLEPPLDIHQLNEVMSKDFTSVHEWLKGNNLSLKVDKATAMVISTEQRERCVAKTNEEFSLNIQEERIDNVLIAKFLDSQVESNLNWNGHIKAQKSVEKLAS